MNERTSASEASKAQMSGSEATLNSEAEKEIVTATPDLTKDQKRAVKRANEQLTKAGLTTYSEMENRLFMALAAAHDGVELGKQLIAINNRLAESLSKYEPVDGGE